MDDLDDRHNCNEGEQDGAEQSHEVFESLVFHGNALIVTFGRETSIHSLRTIALHALRSSAIVMSQTSGEMCLPIVLTTMLWTVEINSGARAFLTAEGTRKLVWRPRKMNREKFLEWLLVGTAIENRTFERQMKFWEQKMRPPIAQKRPLMNIAKS